MNAKGTQEAKCDKFEKLFIQEDETLLLEHIKTCEDCRIEYEKMEKVSGLVKEVSFVYRRQRQIKTNVLGFAASFLILFLSFFAIQFQNPDSFMNETVAYLTGGEYTYEQMGLPVDDYGFIMVDYEF